MDANNTFQGGMNSDISKLFQSPNTYLKALNFRPVADSGNSVAALTNIRGNECEITFPNVRGVYKIGIKPHDTGNYTGEFSLTINGQTTANLTIDVSTRISEFAGSILALTNCYNSPFASNPTFAIAYNEEYITIYQQPEYSGCDSNTSVEPSIIVNTISGTPEIVFYDTSDNQYYTYTPNTPSIAGSSLVVIGSTFINEEIFLLTCPSYNPSQTGQIWKMTYNELTKITTIKLLYNNRLNFSTDFPVPPSAAIGRFELDNLKRIYWSDNNNYVRSCNVEDPNLMVFDIDLINLRPSIGMSIPVLDEILDGQAVNNLATQTTYQCAYRLSKNNGALTNYSPVSNLVYPIAANTSLYLAPQPNFCNVGTFSFTVNKAIKWTVDGIDTDFDTIEFVVIERAYPNEDDFYVYKFDTQPINGQEKISTIFRNPLDKVEITIEEFLLESTVFTHCKTMESKDNRLFFGNVRNDLNTVLESFDSRAYRFSTNGPGTTLAHMKNETDAFPTTVTISTVGDYANIPEDNDNIPVYNLGMHASDDPNYSDQYKYKRSSTILGGEGPNISYSFGSVLLETDAVVNEPVPQVGPNTTSNNTLEGTDADNPTPIFGYNNGYRIPGVGSTSFRVPSYLNGAPNQEYLQRNSRSTLALEYASGLFKSYQHNEIYRFGIVFRSKTGETSFTKWIGDIKFPNYFDQPNPTLAGVANDGSTCPDFRSVYMTGSGANRIAYSVIPYIEFSVTIPADIASIVESYEIVRVKREESDRTIAAHGLVNQVSEGAGPESQNLFLPQSNPSVGSGQLALDPSSTTAPNRPARATKLVVTYHPFEYIAKQSANLIEEDDRLITTEIYKSVKEALVSPSNTILYGQDGYYIKKYYDKAVFLDQQTLNQNPSTSNIFVIKQAVYCPQGAETGKIFSGGASIYKNYNYGLTGNNYLGGAYSQGTQTIVIELKKDNYSSISPGPGPSTYFPWFNNLYESFASSVGGIGVGCKVLAIHFKPSNLENQYGGRTYTKRAQSEYISTGAFYPLDGQVGTKTMKVFGGDIYHSILDIQKAIKNWGPISGIPSGPNQSKKHSQTWYFPTQSVCNIDMRSGYFVNKQLNRNDGTYASGADDYSYNWAANYENNIKKYYPKPIFFNQTDSWNNRFYWSNVKINGETSDSWATIPTNNYYDVEGAYGGINAIVILHNNFYFVQDRAFGSLYINPVASITSTQGFPVTLGKGDTVQKHEYVSIDAGSKHQWSVFRSNTAITFVDSRHKKIYVYNGQSLEPISDTKGVKGFVNKVLHDSILDYDNPITGTNIGILTTYDYLNNEFLYTFRNVYLDNARGEESTQSDDYTLVYSDLTKSFSSFYSFIPYIYINNHNKLYSLKDSNIAAVSIYQHNIGDYGSFYGEVSPSTIKVNVNNNPLYTKVFDNTSWISESVKEGIIYKDNINDYQSIEFNGDSDDIPFLTDTFTQIRCYNEYQNTDWITLSTAAASRTLRKSEQGWNVHIPRNKVNYDSTAINTKSIFDPTILTKTSFKDRLRDKYIVIDLLYPNDINNRFTVHNLKTTFRISPR